MRLPVISVIGTTTWASFHGSGLRMTWQPEHVPPLAENAIPEVVQHGYQAYPLVDHVADKIAATYERYGTAGMPSTRYRDLVDYGNPARTLNEALNLVKPFIDPVLRQIATGHWDPGSGQWLKA